MQGWRGSKHLKMSQTSFANGPQASEEAFFSRILERRREGGSEACMSILLFGSGGPSLGSVTNALCLTANRESERAMRWSGLSFSSQCVADWLLPQFPCWGRDRHA